jgi:hypothetical protein
MGTLAVLPFLLVALWAGIEQADNEKNADLYKDEEEKQMNILTPNNYKTTCPHIKCAGCNDWKCRCGDCIALIEKDGEWYCDLDNKYCKDIKICGEYE